MVTTLANSGVAMGVASVTHLTVGCVLIALVEAGIIRAMAKVPYRRGVGVLLLANFASGWLGRLWLVQQGSWLYDNFFEPPLLRAAWPIFWILFIAAFVLSVVVEWPMVRWAGAKVGLTWRRALVCSLAMHAVTYPALAWYYGRVSSLSLHTQFRFADPATFVDAPPDVWVWFVRWNDGAVCRVRPDGSAFSVVVPGPSADADKEMIYGVAPLPNPAGGWDLWRSPLDSFVSGGPAPSLPQFAQRVADHPEFEAVYPFIAPKDAWLTPRQFGNVPALEGETPSRWEARTGYTLWRAFEATRTVDGERRSLAFETPMFPRDFYMTHAALLGRDLVVLQAGGENRRNEQDCILVVDLERRLVGIIAQGSSPVVAISPPPDAPPVPESATITP